MARKLPFVVQPKAKAKLVKVGTEESGKIEIERRGYISVGEKAMVDQAMVGSRAAANLRELISQIAEIEGKEYSEVFSDLTASPTPEYIESWAAEATECFEAIGLEEARRDMFQATSLLISRIDPEWTMEDTMQQHPDLIKELSAFFTEENRQAIEELEADSASSGAEGKK